MASDEVFYTVLIIAIALAVFLVVFLMFVKKMMPHPLMMKVASTMHACLFGYESALVDLVGPRGYKTHVFPKIIETIAKLKDESELIEAVTKATTVKEAMEKWLDVLKLTKISKEANIVDNGDNSYVITLPHCMMCNPIHEIMGLEAKGICPMALIVAGSSAFANQGKNVEMEYSKFTPTGTSTKISFK